MQNVFFAAAAACFIVGFSLSSFRLTPSAQRRIYWACACLAGIFGFLAPYPNLKTGLAAGGVLLGAMVATAYATSSYIKINGKLYALTVADSQPDPEDAPSDTSQTQKPTQPRMRTAVCSPTPKCGGCSSCWRRSGG